MSTFALPTLSAVLLAKDAEFEEKHPRGEAGKFEHKGEESEADVMARHKAAQDLAMRRRRSERLIHDNYVQSTGQEPPSPPSESREQRHRAVAQMSAERLKAQNEASQSAGKSSYHQWNDLVRSGKLQLAPARGSFLAQVPPRGVSHGYGSHGDYILVMSVNSRMGGKGYIVANTKTGWFKSASNPTSAMKIAVMDSMRGADGKVPFFNTKDGYAPAEHDFKWKKDKEI